MDEIPHEELRVETWPRVPPGGQRVGVVTGVKITHLPTGVEACVNADRSQHRNKRIAYDMILAALTHPDFR